VPDYGCLDFLYSLNWAGGPLWDNYPQSPHKSYAQTIANRDAAKPHLRCPPLLCGAAEGGLLWQTVEKEIMKIAIRAAIAALSIASIGSAYAGDGEGTAANTQFTEIPGVIAQAPEQNAPVFANAQNGQALHAYVARSSHGTWLFPPDQNGGGDN
jgi:hypothetical protein